MNSVKYDINNLEDLKKRILELEKELAELKIERAKQRVKQLEEEIELEKLLPFEPVKIYPTQPYPWWQCPYPDQTWMHITCDTNPPHVTQPCTKSYNQD